MAFRFLSIFRSFSSPLVLVPSASGRCVFHFFFLPPIFFFALYNFFCMHIIPLANASQRWRRTPFPDSGGGRGVSAFQ
ncbi:hypothetical protein DFJ73DRAFT_858420 [Zopfochytrium polystomum]|nr:hypothetical protein DFJ73DRAFT_858420 [Zopfochytrium polystomum]